MTRVPLALAALAMAAAPAVAQVEPAPIATQTHRVHRVKKNDTLQILAAEYYGDRNFVILVMSVNKMKHNDTLRQGQRLQMPIPRPVTAGVDDTWDALADQYLGDKRRGRFLAQFNKMPVETAPAAGTRLLIPYHMTYRAESDVKLANLALTFLFDRSKANLLKDYNFLDRPILNKGETIIIPIHAEVNASKLPGLDAESSARRERRALMQELADKGVAKAKDSWRAGDYANVKAELLDIETAYLDTVQAVEVLVLLGSAHVAFDDTQLATAAFRKALDRDRDHKLTAYHYSPKIRAVWESVDGQVDHKSRE